MNYIDANEKLPELEKPVLAFWGDDSYMILHRGISPRTHREVWFDCDEWDGGELNRETFPVEKWAYLIPPGEEDDGWISVNELLPEPGVKVIICWDDGMRDTDYMQPNGEWAFSKDDPICWQPLPGEPKNLKEFVFQKKYKDLCDDLEALKEMISREDI